MGTSENKNATKPLPFSKTTNKKDVWIFQQPAILAQLAKHTALLMRALEPLKRKRICNEYVTGIYSSVAANLMIQPMKEAVI